VQTAEPEEPRGIVEAEEGHGAREQEEEPQAPNVQMACDPNFGNTDIFGWTSAP